MMQVRSHVRQSGTALASREETVMNCPSQERLASYAASGCSAAQAAEIEAHLAG